MLISVAFQPCGNMVIYFSMYATRFRPVSAPKTNDHGPVTFLLTSFSACNKGNRRRLHAGNISVTITFPFFLVSVIFTMIHFRVFKTLGPVVRTPVNVNPGLNFNPGFFFFLSKALSRIVFSIHFRVSNHPIVDKEN